MNHETTKKPKHNLTDRERDNCLKLLTCGLSTNEVADIVGISRASVGYMKQAHIAAINQDWSTLQRLSVICKNTVDWAMRITGADEVFKETFGEPTTAGEPEPAGEPEITQTMPAPEAITRAEFDYLKQSLSDICHLLIEIRDMLK
jgi:hypothetical protein